MTSDRDSRTETVTTSGPAPAASLPSGMPIADERIGYGKGGGVWLWVAAGAALLAVAIFFVLV